MALSVAMAEGDGKDVSEAAALAWAELVPAGAEGVGGCVAGGVAELQGESVPPSRGDGEACCEAEACAVALPPAPTPPEPLALGEAEGEASKEKVPALGERVDSAVSVSSTSGEGVGAVERERVLVEVPLLSSPGEGV